MITNDATPIWKPWQKITFRFLFLFLGFFLLNYEIIFIFLSLDAFEKFSAIYSSFEQPLYWLDQHFYGIGYNPKLHQNLPGDTHFGVVFYLTIIIIFIIAVIIWSIAERRKTNYDKLNYWFRVYVRYVIALIMFGYGIDKLIPVQMNYPGVLELLTPIGDQSLFITAWNFIGASPGYEIFTGCCEIIASLLLLFRCTYVFGSLLMFAILSNVVALNIFYNVSVKLYSSLLLICVLYLLVPYINK